jgi:AcrR family transcriptional regulator
VLDAARQLLVEGGFAALTVRALATRLGVSRQVVASRFGSMRGLLAALYCDGFARLEARVASVEETPGTDAHVLACARAYRSQALEAPAVYQMLFEDAAGLEPDGAMQDAARSAYRQLVDCAAAWCRGHTAEGRGGRRLAGALWAASLGVIALERAGHLDAEAAAGQLDDVVRRMLAGSRS